MGLKPSLSKGAVILCADGHEVCDVVMDLHKGDTGYSKAFANWRSGQTIPKKGDPLPLLCFCGQPWFEKSNCVNIRHG